MYIHLVSKVFFLLTFFSLPQDKSTYKPLANLYPDQAPYSISNSSLSEYGNTAL